MKNTLSFSITIFHDFDRSQPIWSEFEADGLCYVFQHYCWLRNWYEHIGSRGRLTLCLVAVTDGSGRRLMFLPLGIERRRIGSALVWLGGRVSDYHAPVLGSGFTAVAETLDFQKLWNTVCSRLPKFDLVHFEKQPALVGGLPNPFVRLATAPNVNQAYLTRLGGSWTDYYHAKRSAKTRSTDRRKEKNLRKQGQITFDLSVSPPDIRHAMSRLMDMKTKLYSRKGARNIFLYPGYFDFFVSMAEHRHERMTIRLSTLKVDDEIVAAHWGAETGGRFYWIMPAYDDSRFTAFSPGGLLLRRLMEHCCGSEIEVFDFTIGDDSYKDDWCEVAMSLYDCVMPINLLGRVDAVKAVLFRRVRLAIRKSRALETLFSPVGRLLMRYGS